MGFGTEADCSFYKKAADKEHNKTKIGHSGCQTGRLRKITTIFNCFVYDVAMKGQEHMRTELLPGKLLKQGQEILNCEKQLRRRTEDLEELAGVLRQFEDDALTRVSEKLLKQCEGTQRISARVRAFGNTLIRILSVYEDCEEDVQDLLENGQNRFRPRMNTDRNSLFDYENVLKSMNLHFQL